MICIRPKWQTTAHRQTRGVNTWWMHAVLVVVVLCSTATNAFDLRVAGGAPELRISRSEIIHGTQNLTNAAEQNFDVGTKTLNLNSFSQDLDVGVGTDAMIMVQARDQVSANFRVSLTRSERRDCITANDLQVTLSVGNGSGRLNADTNGGGWLTVANLQAIPRTNGPRCPRNIRYDFDMAVDLANAVQDGNYVGDLLIEVSALRGPSQPKQLATSLTARLPSFLLLYYPSRVETQVSRGALAELLATNSQACATDFCGNVGNKLLTVAQQTADAQIINDVTPLNIQPVIMLRNLVAARALGCLGNNYTSAIYQVRPLGPGVMAANGNIDGIQGQPCGMEPRAGDVALELDLGAPANGNSQALAEIEITVIGF